MYTCTWYITTLPLTMASCDVSVKRLLSLPSQITAPPLARVHS